METHQTLINATAAAAAAITRIGVKAPWYLISHLQKPYRGISHKPHQYSTV